MGKLENCKLLLTVLESGCGKEQGGRQPEGELRTAGFVTEQAEWYEFEIWKTTLM